MPDFDTFTCETCGTLIYRFPAAREEEVPSQCFTCRWLDETIDDPDEREALRRLIDEP